MRITVEDGLYKGSHIPGPSHNYLGVRFGRTVGQSFTIEVLPPIGGNPRAALTADEVRPWIEEGFRIAEGEIGRAFEIERAEIIENDSRRPEVYRELARLIVLRHHEEQPSQSTSL